MLSVPPTFAVVRFKLVRLGARTPHVSGYAVSQTIDQLNLLHDHKTHVYYGVCLECQ